MLRTTDPTQSTSIIKRKLSVGNLNVSHRPGHGSIFHMGVVRKLTKLLINYDKLTIFIDVNRRDRLRYDCCMHSI